MVKVAVLSEFMFLRQALAEMLSMQNGFRVVQQLECAAENVDLIRRSAPDIVIYDFHACSQQVLEALEILQPLSGVAKIIVLVAGRSQQMLKGIKVCAYFDVQHSVLELKSLVKKIAAADWEHYWQPTEPSGDRKKTDTFLTKRELEIIRLILSGKNSREIAGMLGLAPKTVEVHRHNILGKLGISKSSKLINYMTEQPVFGLSILRS